MLQTTLQNIFESVQRAGPVFTGECTVAPKGRGWRITLRLSPFAFNDTLVGAKVKETLRRYLRAEFQARGFASKGLSIKKGYVEVFVAEGSRAASSRAKKF